VKKVLEPLKTLLIWADGCILDKFTITMHN
jgi:hypothetical protein